MRDWWKQQNTVFYFHEFIFWIWPCLCESSYSLHTNYKSYTLFIDPKIVGQLRFGSIKYNLKFQEFIKILKLFCDDDT